MKVKLHPTLDPVIEQVVDDSMDVRQRLREVQKKALSRWLMYGLMAYVTIGVVGYLMIEQAVARHVLNLQQNLAITGLMLLSGCCAFLAGAAYHEMASPLLPRILRNPSNFTPPAWAQACGTWWLRATGF